MFGSCYEHAMAMLWPYLLGPCLNHAWAMIRQFQGHCCVIFGSCVVDDQAVLGSVVVHARVMFHPAYGNTRALLGLWCSYVKARI